jgi:hypothetical protein
MEFIQAGLIALICFAHFMAMRSVERERQRERAEWSQERTKLLHAAMTARPVEIRQEPRPVAPHVVPEDEGELAMVGTVVWGEADE